MPVEVDGEAWVAAVATRAVGLAALTLGGGRTRADQSIDPSTGFSEVVGPGDRVGAGRPLALVHARTDADAARAAAALRAAFELTGTPPSPPGSPILGSGLGSGLGSTAE